MNCSLERTYDFVVTTNGGLTRRPTIDVVGTTCSVDFEQENFLVGRAGKKRETVT
jgi:hypothetical protein